ncbi:MAG TPA: glycosyltransferase family 39 protein [Acidobacteriaceae bacterium]|nr:glycosyltransferase family 39 protein [Acidobacteriaceae bacterium]
MLLVNPRVNSGILDDWSIVRSAQRLAATGHIHYNGWEAPILGWQLYAGALFTRLFGFSFTVMRSANMLEALLTVLLAQRLFVRTGIREGNASFGALTLALCPVFFTSSLLFMTDIPGTLAVLFCLYSCVRALQARTDAAAAGWIITAALTNAVLGTTRQTAWLGLLTMVPSALWMLRRRRAVVIAGGIACLCGFAFMVAVLRWFGHQPYVLPEQMLYAGFPWKRAIAPAARTLSRAGLDLCLLTSPLALALLPRLPGGAHAWRGAAGVLTAYVVLLLLLYGRAPHHDALAPFLLTPGGVQPPETMVLSFPTPILGPSPGHMTLAFRLLLTGIDLLSITLIAIAIRTPKLPVPSGRSITPQSLVLLTVPYSLAYLGLLIPRGVLFFTVERYLVFLLPVAVLWLLHLYQRTTVRNIGLFGLVPLCAFGLYGTFLLHDIFATYRANLEAIDEVRAVGIPREHINGGLEYNFMTQVTLRDYTPANGIRMPDGSLLPKPVAPPPLPCAQPAIEYMPVVQPEFAIAYPSAGCLQLPQFAPVHFTTWLAPHHRTAVVVRYGVSGPSGSETR